MPKFDFYMLRRSAKQVKSTQSQYHNNRINQIIIGSLFDLTIEIPLIPFLPFNLLIMQQQIDEILAIDESIPLKSQALCEQLISQNFHCFFTAIIQKINQLSKSFSHAHQNYDKDFHQNVQRLTSILNRQLYTIIESLSQQDQDKMPQIWSVINQVLMHPDLDFTIFKKMIPSISAFMSLCNDKEVKFIFFSNSSNNQNSEAKIILLMALIECKISKKTKCKITKRSFRQFHQDLTQKLKQLQQKLQNIDEEQPAIDMVCNYVKRWSEYLEIFLKLFQNSVNSYENFTEIKDTISQKSFLQTVRILLSIDQYLLLKKCQDNCQNKVNPNGKKMNFKLLLQSKYSKVNKSINCLKASTLKILKMVIELMSKFLTRQFFNEQNELICFIQSQIIYPGISDLYLIGKYEPKADSKDFLTVNSVEMIRQVCLFLSILIQIKIFRSIITQSINKIATGIQYIFFACMCNIERFEERQFLNKQFMIQNFMNKKTCQKTNDLCVSNLTNKVIPLTNLQIENVIDFIAEISVLTIDESISISQFFQNRQIPRQVQQRVKRQNLCLYFHILSNTTKIQYLRNYAKKISLNLIRFIDLITFEFESVPFIFKTHFLSICLHVSHLWTQKELSININKILAKIKKSLGSQNDQVKIFLEFCCSAIIYLLLEDIQMVRHKKNQYFVQKLFQCLVQSLKSIKMSQPHYRFKILSDLVTNNIWNTDGFSFERNFMIFQIAFNNVRNLDIFLKNNQNLSTNQIKKLLPESDFLNLMGKCILKLQLQFNSENHDMQIKITSMREMVVQIINFFSFYSHLLTHDQIAQICQILQYLSGIHLQENVSPDLCLIIKNDHTLVNTIAQFLGNVDLITKSYLQCVSNIIISLQGNLQKSFIIQAFTKIKESIDKVQILDLEIDLVQKILSFLNIIFLFEINLQFETSLLKQVCKQIIIITRQNQGTSRLSHKRQTQTYNNSILDSNSVKIKLFQFKCFLLSYKIQWHLNLKDFGIKQKKLSGLISQFKNLRKKMSLEDLAYLVYAIGKSLKETKEQGQKELILELGFQIFSLKQKQIQIPIYLNKKVNPIIKIKNMIVEITKLFRNDFTTQNLISVEKLLNGLDCLEQKVPNQKKIRNLKIQNNLVQTEKSYQNQDQDIII